MTESFVYMTDLTTLVEDLAYAGGYDTESIVGEIVHSMGESTAEIAQMYAPKDTGELARSIGVQHGPMESRVYASAPHAAYVEFGTWSHSDILPRSGTYEIRPKNADALRFTAADGNVVFTKLVNHPGVKSQPFMRPAVAAAVEGFGTAIENVGVELVLRSDR